MKNRIWHLVSSLLFAALTTGTALAQPAPEKFVEELSGKVIELVKADKQIQAGDVGRISELVDTKPSTDVPIAWEWETAAVLDGPHTRQVVAHDTANRACTAWCLPLQCRRT